MSGAFDWFVIFADMRTGSNFLEANLNSIAGITCHGEAFNPHFIGYPNRADLLGVTQQVRDADPHVLLDRIRQGDEIGGFRYFHDHDPRVLDTALKDTRCAKIILTRNPVDSYVSWKIAQTTGQWKLTDVARRRDARATFDAVEFADFLERTTSFQQDITRQLQVSGQTAFRLQYNDLNSVEIINGIAAFLEIPGRLDKLDATLKVQNPAPMSEKVENFDEMEQALSGWDVFGLQNVPDYEPRRQAAVPSYVAAAKAPLLYLPIRGGPQAQVMEWMAALDGATADDLLSRMSRKDLRQWQRKHKNHRSFTVLSHPVVRAHRAFCQHILGTGKPVYAGIRQTLIRRYGLQIPKSVPDETYRTDQHHAAFATFLRFLRGNLAGQTGIRVDGAWCSQAQAVQGFGHLKLPDMLLREDELVDELPALARRVGYSGSICTGQQPADRPFALSEIYDDEIERLAASAYQRDYVVFGFTRWR